MMKKIIVAAFSATLLWACTGRQGKAEQLPVNNADTVVAALISDSIVDEEVTTDQPVAFEAWKLICEGNGVEVKKTCPVDCTVEYTESDEPAEGFFVDDQVGCFPMKSGGWAVCHQHIEAAESSPGYYAYETYTYAGGKLEKADFLVVPPIDELLDAQKCSGHEEIVAQIKKNYSSRAKDFLVYYFKAKEKTVEVNLRPIDYESEESSDNWTESHFGLVKPAIYHWNGERFVEEKNL